MWKHSMLMVQRFQKGDLGVEDQRRGNQVSRPERQKHVIATEKVLHANNAWSLRALLAKLAFYT